MSSLNHVLARKELNEALEAFEKGHFAQAHRAAASLARRLEAMANAEAIKAGKFREARRQAGCFCMVKFEPKLDGYFHCTQVGCGAKWRDPNA